ncbi:MAG: hypothetical protein PHT12_05475 [Patescibacteria group bacterium]|nr:hypothetical protein [Patescibacteria group bacterium]
MSRPDLKVSVNLSPREADDALWEMRSFLMDRVPDARIMVMDEAELRAYLVDLEHPERVAQRRASAERSIWVGAPTEPTAHQKRQQIRLVDTPLAPVYRLWVNYQEPEPETIKHLYVYVDQNVSRPNWVDGYDLVDRTVFPPSFISPREVTFYVFDPSPAFRRKRPKWICPRVVSWAKRHGCRPATRLETFAFRAHPETAAVWYNDNRRVIALGSLLPHKPNDDYVMSAYAGGFEVSASRMGRLFERFLLVVEHSDLAAAPRS